MVKENSVAVTAAVSGTVSQLEWTVQTFGVTFSVLMAGFAGAMIALWLIPPTKRWYVTLTIGTVAAAYLTPFVAKVSGMDEQRAIAFLLGLCAHFLGTLFFHDGREIILGALRSRFGIEKDSAK